MGHAAQQPLSRCCIHRGIDALSFVLVWNHQTKVVRWPRDSGRLLSVYDNYRMHYKLPGCAGAIDSSIIPMLKPSAYFAGGDGDAYWNYKGHPAQLLLAVVDRDLLFTFINVAGTAGDSGLYKRSPLYQQSDHDAGLLDGLTIPLPVENEVHDLKRYFVGDGAFPYGPHMLKDYNVKLWWVRDSPSHSVND